MKQIIFILLIAPTSMFSQCVFGDCENGVGTYIWEDGTVNDGSWKNGELDGVAVEISYSENGDFRGIYEGGFIEGVMSGWGTATYYDEDGYQIGTYVGNFLENDFNGWGIWIWTDGTFEKGIYIDGELVKETE